MSRRTAAWQDLPGADGVTAMQVAGLGGGLVSKAKAHNLFGGRGDHRRLARDMLILAPLSALLTGGPDRGAGYLIVNLVCLSVTSNGLGS